MTWALTSAQISAYRLRAELFALAGQQLICGCVGDDRWLAQQPVCRHPLPERAPLIEVLIPKRLAALGGKNEGVVALTDANCSPRLRLGLAFINGSMPAAGLARTA